MSVPFVHAQPIEARIKSNEFVEAGLHDFRLGTLSARPEGGHWSPYALSPDCATLWWVRTPSPLHQLEAPFYYLAQYRNATHLAEIRASDLPPAAGGARTLVFSVGRCGSTLLVEAARSSGLSCLSEPDAITPLGLDRPEPPNARGVYARVVDACVEAWAPGRADDRALVKLRAQHSNAAHLRLASAALRDVRVVFVFREPRAWARSMAGHFDLPVDRLLALYSAPLGALRSARESGIEARVLLYEEMDGPALAGALDLGGAPRLPERSSQAGTRLARRPPTNEKAAATVDAFMAQWPALGARELGLPY